MGDLTRVVSDVLMLLIRVGGLVVGAVEFLEVSLREQLAARGASPLTQSLIFVVLAFATILLALRLLGGILRWVVIVVLALAAIKLLMPALLLPSR